MGKNNGSVVDNSDYSGIPWDGSRLVYERPASPRLDVCQLRPSEHRTDLDSKTMVEKDPNGIDLKAGGAKADLGKSPIAKGCFTYFPRALLEVAKVSARGAEKYSWKGWETVPDGVSRYFDAIGRHMVAEGIEGDYDSQTGCLHAAQVAWNALARLELILREKNEHYP